MAATTEPIAGFSSAPAVARARRPMSRSTSRSQRLERWPAIGRRRSSKAPSSRANRPSTGAGRRTRKSRSKAPCESPVDLAFHSVRERKLAVIGAALDLGSGRRGVDMGPSAIRYAGLEDRLARLGFECDDLGNVRAATPEATESGDPHARFLPQIKETCA